MIAVEMSTFMPDVDANAGAPAKSNAAPRARADALPRTTINFAPPVGKPPAPICERIFELIMLNSVSLLAARWLVGMVLNEAESNRDRTPISCPAFPCDGG